MRREILSIELETKIKNEVPATAIASKTSLKKDWLKSEEDEAWKDL
ncbi:MAG: hypothetical protein SFH39_09710 [Candidatus Magnetobacterium sp. LHC-1]|uniref:DUF2281 domain-containing protein n=1 Tax=Candidatus Magnetobacterium casense TaxID=1455061 RepID=A0ABS6RV93_9BACT|nr:hypothetical protein [Candidatus Magnetobacterium casensis]MBV6340270.1 hypothetical protein [Candidatus Magnetobacterium casensis]